MSEIWDKMIECESAIIEKCSALGEETFDDPEFGWLNRVFRGEHFRRAHIDSVDARDSKGLYMTHICVFPNYNNDAPIYGFDIICGKNKVTGAFHDYSRSVNPDHVMMQGYAESVKNFIPEKKRELPEWARNIFTGKMLAAGNVKDEDEATEIIRIATDNLRAYFDEVGISKGEGIPEIVQACQDYYCHNQQQNPHTPNVMKSLGLPEEDVDVFCTDMLFPKLG